MFRLLGIQPAPLLSDVRFHKVFPLAIEGDAVKLEHMAWGTGKSPVHSGVYSIRPLATWRQVPSVTPRRSGSWRSDTDRRVRDGGGNNRGF